MYTKASFPIKRKVVDVKISSLTDQGEQIVKMRALSLAQIRELREACGTYPQAPLVADLSKGSLAAPVPNELDPEFLKKRAAWGHLFTMAQVAKSMDYQPAGFTEKVESLTAWALAAAKEIEEIFTDSDVAALIAGMRSANGEDVDPKKS